MALLDGHRDHAGTGVVAGAIPRQLVGVCLEEPRHLHIDRIDRSVGNALGSAVRGTAGPESPIGLDVGSDRGLGFLRVVGF